MGIFSRKDRNGERVDASDYMETVATTQSLDALCGSGVTDRRGRAVRPLARETKRRRYDADAN
jgi:hypothetical protein